MFRFILTMLVLLFVIGQFTDDEGPFRYVFFSMFAIVAVVELLLGGVHNAES